MCTSLEKSGKTPRLFKMQCSSNGDRLILFTFIAMYRFKLRVENGIFHWSGVSFDTDHCTMAWTI